MEEIEARGKHFEAAGNGRFMAPGRAFQLTGHFDLGWVGSTSSEGDNEFMVIDVRHRKLPCQIDSPLLESAAVVSLGKNCRGGSVSFPVKQAAHCWHPLQW